MKTTFGRCWSLAASAQRTVKHANVNTRIVQTVVVVRSNCMVMVCNSAKLKMFRPISPAFRAYSNQFIATEDTENTERQANGVFSVNCVSLVVKKLRALEYNHGKSGRTTISHHSSERRHDVST